MRDMVSYFIDVFTGPLLANQSMGGGIIAVMTDDRIRGGTIIIGVRIIIGGTRPVAFQAPPNSPMS